MHRKRARVAASFAIVLAAALVADPAGAGRRKAAHNLVFEDINPRSVSHGERVALEHVWSDRGAVLQFVASWCKPCREELPELQAVVAAGRAPVVLVAADEGPAGTDNILVVAERAALTMPILFVPPEAVADVNRHYGHDVLPATYFIDERGRIRALRLGPLDSSALAAEIHAVIARD